MKVHLFALLLLVSFCTENLFSPQAVHAESKAVPALAVPVALASISALEAAVLCAAAAGLITVTQSEAFQRELKETSRAIRNMTADAWNAASYGVKKMIARIEKALSNKGYDLNSKTCARPGTSSLAIPKAQATTRTHTDYCGNPAECCKDFMNKFGKDLNSYSMNKNNMKRIYKGYEGRGKLPKKMDCCLEWDGQHHGWEIFDNSGRHMGERSCSDLSNNDACKGSDPSRFGTHVSPNSGTHRPRICFK